MNLKELAKTLNLSISTVSKALRDSHEISTAIKQKVLAKAKELNYQVNPYASSLRKQKSKTIGVVIPEIDNNFFALVINGIESIAEEKGYHVLIYLTHEDVQRESSIMKLLSNRRVDGVMISLSSQTKDTTHLEEVRQMNIPLVFFDRVAEHLSAPKITTDDYNSGLNATDHLIKKGCKQIAFLSISNNLSITNKRKKGFEDALKNAGIPINEKMIVSCGNDELKCKALIKKLLTKKIRPDGIFVTVEKLAVYTYEVCAALNLRIPQDVKVISFSNMNSASILNPSLTTITQPAFQIGREAADILLKLVEKKDFRFIQEKIILKSTLIERNSTNSIL